MTYVWTQQLTCFLLLLSLSGPRAVFSSTVEVFEDEKTKELSISVESSRPETTFSGRIGIRNTFGYFYRLHQDFAAKEEFCFFTVALGMRNFSCHAFATKYWDLDTEIEVSNSEGDVLRTGKLGDQGKAKITVTDVARTDIYQICIKNYGSAKTIRIIVALMDPKKVQDFRIVRDNLGKVHNVSTEAASRINARLAEVISDIESSYSNIAQDVYRLLNIRKWVNARGALGSIAMLCCTGLSTFIIRRWFGSPRTSI
ncbi:hypothetical protein BOX15_Mlig021488g2 [Macrostomum lignano]|uniref:GOLD domain-containing protein n=1 Tax=Macrostomum lignano TaxID=282301 RepID=A0A267ENV8_9PLAT|nr:hypothetical protein BOX15_Mlig021488g2 [Macrostomum lignano]